ncbi:MAG: hypothetical protein WEA10_02260 [Actinomycetota bacterium]
MYDWTYLDDSGDEVGRSERFADSESAEAWITTAWRDLADRGVEQVELFDRVRARSMYRMGLESSDPDADSSG